MRRLPPEPQVGDRITAELVRELTRCIRERTILRAPGYKVLSGPNGTSLSLDKPPHRQARDKPLPFEVRWDATLSEGAGGWKIYLPTEHLLSYGGVYVSTSDISGATPIPDANGDDTAWSVLDGIDTSADHVWLVVTVPDEGDVDEGDISAEFAAVEGQSVTGSSVLSVCIAEVSYEASEEEGGAPKIEIKQSVVGALCLGGGSEGGGEGGGGSVTLDDASTDFNGDDEVQIKDWDTGTPASDTTIAHDIQNGLLTSQDALVSRTTGGVLKYKKPGTIQELLGSTVTFSGKKVLTGLVWDTTTHKYVISSATVSAKNGVITSWTDNPQPETIATTPISSIINS